MNKKTNKKQSQVQVIKNNGSQESNEYKKLVLLIVIIATVFLLFYLVTVLFTKDNNKDSIFKNDLNATEIQYDEILVGTMLKQNSKEYYVLLEEENDPYKKLFENYITTIRTGKNKIYTINLSSGFNKSYISDEASYDEENFKVNGTTLLKIENEKIVDHYNDKEKINELLSTMSKEVSD